MFFTNFKRTVSSGVVKNLLRASIANMSSTPTFETLQVTVPKPFVYHVEFNRPNKMNAINGTMWDEIRKCFEDLNKNSDCRAIILSGTGKVFSAGIDLTSMMSLSSDLTEDSDLARKGRTIYNSLTEYQNTISGLEKCVKPVLCAVHSGCIGAGVDIITATDMRYCTKDAYFQVKEVLIGMAADVGTLQRLPKIIGSQSLVRELCYTGRKFSAEEALSCGLVSKIFDDRESLITEVVKIAEEIASLSPVAVQTIKTSLNYSRDHTAQEGLEHIALLNQFLLQSEDFANGVMSQISKETPIFAKL